MHAAEAVLSGSVFQRGLHALFNSLREGEILHCSTLGTEEMVVVAGEVLGELVPGEFVGGNDFADYTGFLQDDEIPVDRTLGQGATPGHQHLGECERSLRVAEDLDDRLTVGGVSLSGGRETLCRDLV